MGEIPCEDWPRMRDSSWVNSRLGELVLAEVGKPEKCKDK